jgi:hypothetical protein
MVTVGSILGNADPIQEFNLLPDIQSSKLAQEWELHVSMKINIILHCELKFSFSE